MFCLRNVHDKRAEDGRACEKRFGGTVGGPHVHLGTQVNLSQVRTPVWKRNVGRKMLGHVSRAGGDGQNILS